MQFKDGMNTKKVYLNYYLYDLIKNKFIDNSKKNIKKMELSLFKIILLPMLKLSGNILYRYLGLPK